MSVENKKSDQFDSIMKDLYSSDVNPEWRKKFFTDLILFLDFTMKPEDKNNYISKVVNGLDPIIERLVNNSEEVPSGYDVDYIYFDTEKEAKAKIDCLNDLIKMYGYACVADYYTTSDPFALHNKPMHKTTITDYAWGWVEDQIDEFKVAKCPKRRNKPYTIIFPDPVKFEKKKED